MSLTIKPIGTITTPFETLEGMPIQPSGAREVKGTILLEKEYEDGLQDLDGFSHIILLYHLHQSQGYDLTVKPFLDKEKRGLFSTRAPRRPNPIGLSVVRLLTVEGCHLHIQGIDVLNNTPLIDIKPYVPAFEAGEDVRTGWLEKQQGKARTVRSDGRFVEHKES